MSFLEETNADAIMEKYNQASELGQNIPPIDSLTNKKIAYNISTGKNDVLLPMDGGGYVVLAELDKDKTQEIKEYAHILKDMPFDIKNYEAAGYTLEEVEAAGIMPKPVEKTGRTEPLTRGEELLITRSGGSLAKPREQTLREKDVQWMVENGEGELRQIYEVLGMDYNEALDLARRIFGNVNSTRGDLGLGIADFTPMGIFYGSEEGINTYLRGRNSGDNVTAAFGALEAGLSLIEAFPVTAAGAKGLKKNIPLLRQALADLGQQADKKIADEGATIYSNPITPMTNRMLSLVGKLVKPEEKLVISNAFPEEQIATQAQAQIATQKNNYKAKDGWLQERMEVNTVKQKKDGKIEVTYKEVPYNFHIAPEGVDPKKWEQTITRKTINEIKALAKRAQQGDVAAKKIIAEAKWYRSMRARMRQEFGGLGDVFADLLGTTSAQTGVTQNFDNAVEIMRRYSRGEFDEEIRMYEEMLASGDTDPIKLGQLHKDPNSPFKLITKASGSLFNANSPASTRALLDMFRSAKGSPKTPNFTGNLIGYTNAATVDVWAARFLRRMSGQKRLPPPIEKGVAGKHLVDSTLQDPVVGSEFGFGQRVIKAAVDNINKSNVIKNVAPEIGDMGADDLQAVLWFMEKEKWTAKGWTSKAGEGGSLDFEASLAGAADQSRVKELRNIINAGFTPLKPLKKKADETDEAYNERMEVRNTQARQAYDQAKIEAEKELAEQQAPLARYVLGIAVERPGQRPTNLQQAETAAKLGEPAKADSSVVMYQVNNTYGRFMQSDERAFNAEFVVRENFDPTNVKKRMVEVAKDADQDAAFISKIVPERTDTSRPGVEIYFKLRQGADFARDLSDKLTEYGIDGFTFITDARVQDMPARQAGMNEEAVAGITGLRFQYIPEFDMGADAWNALSQAEKAAKIDEIEDIYDEVILDLNRQNADISTAIVTHNETEVIERGSYDAILGAPTE